MEEIYTHRFVCVEQVYGVGPKDPGGYDIAVRYHDGTTFVVEAASDMEDALNVASEIAEAFESWMEPGSTPTSITGDPMGDALLRSADILWSAVSEGAPYDEVIDHVDSLLRGFLTAEDVATVTEWADIRQCSLTESVHGLHQQRQLEAAEDAR